MALIPDVTDIIMIMTVIDSNKYRRRKFLRHSCSLAAVVSSLNIYTGNSFSAPKDNLKRVADWVSRSFVGGKINLLPNLPSGKVHSGAVRDDLKNLYWLQNCNLFGMHALRPYNKTLADKIGESYRKWYKTEFADCLEKTEHYLAIGQQPADRGS